MVKKYVEVVLRPSPEKPTLTAGMIGRMYAGRSYIINRPVAPYDPENRNIESLVHEALTLTEVYPEHQITLHHYSNGQRKITVKPVSAKAK